MWRYCRVAQGWKAVGPGEGFTWREVILQPRRMLRQDAGAADACLLFELPDRCCARFLALVNAALRHQSRRIAVEGAECTAVSVKCRGRDTTDANAAGFAFCDEIRGRSRTRGHLRHLPCLRVVVNPPACPRTRALHSVLDVVMRRADIALPLQSMLTLRRTRDLPC